MATWKKHFSFAAALTDADPRGVWVLHEPGGDGVATDRQPVCVGAPAEEGPLVSCIMPTHNRRRYVARAIAYFLRQDYPHRELLILDDGADRVEDLVPDDARVRYIGLKNRQRLGAKRNLGCEAARGDLIAHWDDDDWMAPWRLRYQIEHLLGEKADLCGLDRLFFVDPRREKAWQYRYSGSRRWLAGGTLCYHKRVWQTRPFEAVDVGEDTRFVWAHQNRRLLALPDPSFYVALVHAHNTSPKRTRSARWHGQPLADIKTLMGEDWPFYANRPGAAVSPRPPRPALSTRDDRPRVTVSIPYYRCKLHIRRAVESILNQTYTPLRVVIVNDADPDPPWDVLADLDDPRIVRFDLEGNYGRYFADAVVVQATDDSYFLLQDADDWSEPRRLEALLRVLRAEHAVAALSAGYVHDPRRSGRPSRETHAHPDPSLDARFKHRYGHVGLFRTEALRNIGGYYGGFRIGYDTLLMNLLLMTGHVAYLPQPLYNRQKRGGSLTTAPQTGQRSARRRAVSEQLRQLYDRIYPHYLRYLDGTTDIDALARQIRKTVSARIPVAHQQALVREVERLRACLQKPTTAAPLPPSKPATLRG